MKAEDKAKKLILKEVFGSKKHEEIVKQAAIEGARDQDKMLQQMAEWEEEYLLKFTYPVFNSDGDQIGRKLHSDNVNGLKYWISELIKKEKEKSYLEGLKMGHSDGLVNGVNKLLKNTRPKESTLTI